MGFLRGLVVAAVLASGSLAASSAAQAAAATFNFESSTITGQTGAYTSLTVTDNGLTATFTRPGSSFDIRDISGGGPVSFGTHTLSPFVDTGNTTFVVTFSQPITALTFAAGDFFADSDTISATAYSGANATGSAIGTTGTSYPSTLGFPNDIASLSLSGSPFLSVAFIGGSTSFPNSIYFDNFVATFTATSVPEPASIMLLGAGLLGMCFAKRRRLV